MSEPAKHIGYSTIPLLQFGEFESTEAAYRSKRKKHLAAALAELAKAQAPCNGCRFESNCAQMELVCKGFMAWADGGECIREEHPEPVPANGWLDADDLSDCPPGYIVIWRHKPDGLARTIERRKDKKKSVLGAAA